MKAIKIGKLRLKSNIFYSPLAGCSDFPFRQMAARYKPGLMYCEMVHTEALTRGIKDNFTKLQYNEAMRPIGAQIVGSRIDLAGPSARIIADLGFDIVDLNCGCPVDHVTKDGSGSGLLKNPEKIGEMIANMKAAVDIPVTLKIRAGWDDNNIVAAQITKIAYEAGADAIAIHGRTREQGYRGSANWDYIKACKEAVPEMIVIGNGDLFKPEDAFRMVEQSGCDAVLVSRGTMGVPWIAEEIRRFGEGLPPLERSFEDIREALLDHYDYTINVRSEKEALLDMRRVACWYFKNVHHAKKFRNSANGAQTLDEMRQIITNFTP